MAMTPAQVRTQIAAGETRPIYLLEGDDLQARHDLALEFGGLVEDGLQAFNVESFFGNEATAASHRDQMLNDILATARTLPMMAPRRVVLVHEADQLLTPRRVKEEAPALPGVASRGKGKRAVLTPAEEFEAYVAAPEPMTTLVLVTEPLDGTRRVTKLLRAKAAVVDCGSLESAADAARWIRARLDRDELSIQPEAIAALLEGTGLRLARIRAEVEKLVLYAAGESAVTVSHVKDLVLPQHEPGEDFALGKAIWNGDARLALREIAAQFDAGAQAPMVLGQIRAAAGRLRPDARAKRGLEQVFDADLAVKSSGGEPRYLLERLVVELCAGGGGGGWGRR